MNDNERNATIEFEGDIAKITNLRDFNWRSSKDFDERWINEDYDLKEAADKLFSVLMGEDVPERREFIETHASEVTSLDI